MKIHCTQLQKDADKDIRLGVLRESPNMDSIGNLGNLNKTMWVAVDLRSKGH